MQACFEPPPSGRIRFLACFGLQRWEEEETKVRTFVRTKVRTFVRTKVRTFVSFCFAFVRTKVLFRKTVKPTPTVGVGVAPTYIYVGLTGLIPSSRRFKPKHAKKKPPPGGGVFLR